MSSRADSATSMRLLLLALVPGAVAQTAVFGIGTLLNLSLCALACLATEAICLRARGHAPLQQLRDGSALLSGLLLGFALPAHGPWWLPMLGGVLAIGIGKQLFGPRGQSPFNPAMVGLALLLLCVPQEMTRWLPMIDGVSSATVLDHVRTELYLARTLEEIFGGTRLYERGETWINLAFLFGGLWLLQQRRLPWRIPAGVLAGLALPAVVFWLGDTSLHASPLFHLFSGSTMLGAFFIAAAPPSSPRAARAQWIYSLGIGAAVYAIRSWGEYPDGFAFAVLLFNAAAPALDRWTTPAVDGSARNPRWALAAIALVLAATTTITSTALQQRRANALPDLADLGFRDVVS
ncbi:MAG: RnfABCDGE type electron transport complex subunit D, partial [Pseudomonadota bacterium]|nr:RnfABCDGE type electron transport complex subunit D [Pseudomonadota bacterium]